MSKVVICDKVRSHRLCNSSGRTVSVEASSLHDKLAPRVLVFQVAWNRASALPYLPSSLTVAKVNVDSDGLTPPESTKQMFVLVALTVRRRCLHEMKSAKLVMFETRRFCNPNLPIRMQPQAFR